MKKIFGTVFIAIIMIFALILINPGCKQLSTSQTDGQIQATETKVETKAEIL